MLNGNYPEFSEKEFWKFFKNLEIRESVNGTFPVNNFENVASGKILGLQYAVYVWLNP